MKRLIEERDPIKIIVGFFSIILIVYLFYLIVDFQINYFKTKNDVKKNYKVTTGQIIDYYTVGIHESVYITYNFYVGNKSYKREKNTSYQFPECKELRNECLEKKRFWVIYSPDDPNKSLTNLGIEIQGIENPKFPKDLDGFR